MNWHQPWLLMLQPRELEDLHDECREREKLNLGRGAFGLAKAWAGLAHEVVERALELERESGAKDPKIDQLVLEDRLFRRGAYDDGPAH